MGDREVIDQIKQRVNIVDIIGRTVKLRKSGGSEWSGCCPFHSERTPSFYVVPNKEMWHCFGCNEGGDIIQFVMKLENLTFPEAIAQLAAEAGVELPKRERVDSDRDRRIARLRAVLEEAHSFFMAQLLSEEDAMCYLQGRGLTSGFVEQAGLGVAPPTWDMLVKHLRTSGFKDQEMEAAGVAAQGQKGPIDFLRNRITIPIRDHLGKLVAFGGRVLDDAKPKYLNTRETELFRKGETLFGLNEARAHLQDGALVVEGYFDVLTLQHLGLGFAVAPLGTALTEAHLDRLAKYTKRITLCFDGDEAGHRAMEKTLQTALPKGFDIRLLELPSGEDPDTWAMSVGAEAFRDLVRSAPDWTSFKVARAMKDRDMRRIPDRMAVLQDLAPLLRFSPVDTRDTFFAALAHQLQLPTVEVARAAGVKADAVTAAPTLAQPEPTTAQPRAKVAVAIKALAVAWHEEETRRRVVEMPRSWWQHLEGSVLLEEILDYSDVGPEADALLSEARALGAVGMLPNLDRLAASLEAAYIDQELAELRRAMDDPRTQPEARMEYGKAITGLLDRRSRLLRGRGRLEPLAR